MPSNMEYTYTYRRDPEDTSLLRGLSFPDSQPRWKKIGRCARRWCAPHTVRACVRGVRGRAPAPLRPMHAPIKQLTPPDGAACGCQPICAQHSPCSCASWGPRCYLPVLACSSTTSSTQAVRSSTAGRACLPTCLPASARTIWRRVRSSHCPPQPFHPALHHSYPPHRPGLYHVLAWCLLHAHRVVELARVSVTCASAGC